MSNEIYQNIFNILQPVLPEGWKKLILFAGYTAGSYTMKYYIVDENDNYIDCFQQSGVSKAQLIKLFMNIDHIIRIKRNQLDSKNRWSVMTMIIRISVRMSLRMNRNGRSGILGNLEKRNMFVIDRLIKYSFVS